MTVRTRTVVAAALAATTVCGSLLLNEQRTARAERIAGPYAVLLESSTDLGASGDRRVRLTAALRSGSSPELLTEWARPRGLEILWRAGDQWATVAGPAAAVADAFGLDVHDYRGRQGQVFYASPYQPVVPAGLGGEVTGFGRILGYTPHHSADRWHLPLEVPGQGCTGGTRIDILIDSGDTRVVDLRPEFCGGVNAELKDAIRMWIAPALAVFPPVSQLAPQGD